MGYVPCKGEKSSELLASSYEIDVAGSRVKPKFPSNLYMILRARERKPENFILVLAEPKLPCFSHREKHS